MFYSPGELNIVGNVSSLYIGTFMNLAPNSFCKIVQKLQLAFDAMMKGFLKTDQSGNTGRDGIHNLERGSSSIENIDKFHFVMHLPTCSIAATLIFKFGTEISFGHFIWYILFLTRRYFSDVHAHRKQIFDF